MRSICFVAAGSGGHILPAITLAKRWKKENDGKVLFITSSNNVDKKVISDEEINANIIFMPLGKIPGKNLLKYPSFFLQVASIFIKSIITFYKFKPEKIVSTGGLLSIPVCFVGRLMSIPIDVYELNAVPGRAAKLISKFATTIFITFKNAKKSFQKETMYVEYPLRFSDKSELKTEKIYENIGFDPNKKIIFLLGGSQGSEFLNNLLKDWASRNINSLKDMQIIHQTGSQDPLQWKQFYDELGCKSFVFDYKSDLKNFYMIADVIISRAGAGTLFEIKHFNKSCIIIPLKAQSTTHQNDNANYMSQEYPDIFTTINQSEIVNNNLIFDKSLNNLLNRI